MVECVRRVLSTSSFAGGLGRLPGRLVRTDRCSWEATPGKGRIVRFVVLSTGTVACRRWWADTPPKDREAGASVASDRCRPTRGYLQRSPIGRKVRRVLPKNTVLVVWRLSNGKELARVPLGLVVSEHSTSRGRWKDATTPVISYTTGPTSTWLPWSIAQTTGEPCPVGIDGGRVERLVGIPGSGNSTYVTSRLAATSSRPEKSATREPPNQPWYDPRTAWPAFRALGVRRGSHGTGTDSPLSLLDSSC